MPAIPVQRAEAPLPALVTQRSARSKALRRTYITSALVCGRNPKLVAGELGHTTSRMVVEVYDSFLDPTNWPDELERRRLAAFYGWRDVAPLQHPRVRPAQKRKGPTRS